MQRLTNNEKELVIEGLQKLFNDAHLIDLEIKAPSAYRKLSADIKSISKKLNRPSLQERLKKLILQPLKFFNRAELNPSW